jgi:hypothetical protein
VASQSYTYGFNNLVADIWVALMLGVLLGYRLLSRQSGHFVNSISALVPDSASVSRDPWLFRAFLGLLVFTLGIVAAWFALLPWPYSEQTGYFIPRLELMAMGLKPYSDFQYFYGPAMLYVPHLLYIFSGRSLSIEQSYLVALLANWGVGLYLLYYVLSRLRGNFARAMVYCLIAFDIFNLTLGNQFTPLRFLVPLASMIFLHRLVLGAAGEGRRDAVRAAAAAFVIPLLSFSVSPEVGVATALGSIVYFAHLGRTTLRHLGHVCLAPAIAAFPAVAVVFSPAYFKGLTSMLVGGNNFPIFPTPGILCVLIAAFCVLPALAAAGLRTREPSGSAALAICTASGLLLPAAFGRCDPIHVSCNAAAILLLFLAALTQAGYWLRFWGLITYVGVFLIIGQASFWNACAPDWGQIFAARSALKGTPAARGISHGLRYSKPVFDPQDYQALLRFEKIGVPVWNDEGVRRFLKLNGRFAPDYTGTAIKEEIFTQAQLERKIKDLHSMRFIVVLAAILQPLPPDDLDALAREDSTFLTDLLVFPIDLKPRNSPFSPVREVILQYKPTSSRYARSAIT